MKKIKIHILMLSVQAAILLPLALQAQTPGLFITSGGSITSTGPSSIYINNGDFINSGTFSSTGGNTVKMTSSTPQSIGGSAVSNFENLTINNTQNVTINKNVFIKSKLRFDAGTLVTGADTVVMSDCSIITGAAPDRYIDGYCRKIGLTAFTFPVGHNGIYAPIGISDGSNGNTTDFFTASWVDGEAPYDSTQHDPSIVRLSSQEYWLLERSGTSYVYVTLSWNPHSGGVNSISDMTVAHWNGSLWEDAGNTVSFGDYYNGTITSDLVKTFSPFTLASTSLGHNPLPIQLISLAAQRVNDYVDILWTTATETNNDYFTLEHSNDASNWQVLTTVKGAGNSNSLLNYTTTDTDPFQGTTYYRLKQTDFDGKSEYVGIVSCSDRNVAGPDEKPVVNLISANTIQISIESSGKCTTHINIYDIAGNIVRKSDVEVNKGGNTFFIDADQLQAGLYIVSLVSDISTHSAKILL